MILQAVSAGVRDMADGSLRITFEFDPRFAADAFKLFGARGASVGIAALHQSATIAAAQQQTIAAAEPKHKHGPLCVLACRWCAQSNFWDFLNDAALGMPFCESEADARQLILTLCGIESRRDLDHNADAKAAFHSLIRVPFMAWLE